VQTLAPAISWRRRGKKDRSPLFSGPLSLRERARVG
jgi:hypothetical protein